MSNNIAANIGVSREKALCIGDMVPCIVAKFLLPNKSARRDWGNEDNPPQTTAYGIQRIVIVVTDEASDMSSNVTAIANKRAAIM